MEVAEAIDFKFVYGFVPKDGSLQNMIEKKATEIAREIVLRTSQTMKLENQEVGEERLEKAVHEKVENFMLEIPRSLWD